MDDQSQWNPAILNGDPNTQCAAWNGCQCLLGDGHDGDHRCAHGYWLNPT